MPGPYVKMRDKFKSKGMPAKAAKKKAAQIYNAKRPKGAAPVTRNYEKTAAKRRAKKAKKKE